MANNIFSHESGIIVYANDSLLNTVDFEQYLFKYCKILNDFRNEYLGDFYRITSFHLHGYHIIVNMKNGECEKIEYTKIN